MSINKLFVSSFLFVFLLTTGLALAQTTTSPAPKAETVTAVDLGVADPGLLPTNPFYFLKEWRREIRSFFAFNPVSKAELELLVVNQKAVELRQLQETRPEDESGLDRALENYQKSQDRLKSRLEALKETSQNPQVDKLLDQLTDRAVKHEKLFSELEKKVAYDSAKLIIQDIKAKIGDSASVAAEKDETVKFVSRLEKALVASPGSKIKHFWSVEVIDQLEQNAPEELKSALDKLRGDLTERLGEDLKDYLDKFGPDAAQKAIADLPGDLARRSVLLEEIRAKSDKRTSEALKKSAEVLDQLSEQSEKLTAQMAQKQIRAAEESAERLEKAVASAVSSKKAVKVLLAGVRERIQGAKAALEKQQYGQAFGFARSAEVLARNGLEMLEPKEKESEKQVEAKPVPAQTVCTQEYAPVCGVNAKTYSNVCVAKAAGVAVKYSGECKKPAEPVSVKEPVTAIPPAVTAAVSEPVDKEFKFEADDKGFYEPYPAKIESIALSKGVKVRIYFSVREQDVYYRGLDFQSPKFKTVSIIPGQSAAVEFTTSESFLISSVWPASNQVKANLKINVSN